MATLSNTSTKIIIIIKIWEGSREGSNPYELWGEPRFYSHIPLLKKKKKKENFDKLSLCDIVLEAWEKKCTEVKIDQILKFI